MDPALALIGVAWLAIALMLAWGVVVSLYRLFAGPPALPFFSMLERRGLEFAQVERAVAPDDIRAALARCAACGARRSCGARAPFDCPNERLFLRVRAFAKAGLMGG